MGKHPDCNYLFLRNFNYTNVEKCERIAKDICSSGTFFNMYHLYFCQLEGKTFWYLCIAVFFFLYMLINLNYIRRIYYIQHIQKLRIMLRLPDFIVESILVPISYGVLPIFIRILACFHQIDFSFHTGANIGAGFALITLFTGICSVRIGVSPKIDIPTFHLNMASIFLGNLLHIPLGSRKVINTLDGYFYLALFVVYMVFRYFLAQRSNQR